MSLLLYHSKRFLKRILWKLFPKSDDQCLKILEGYLAKGLYPKVASINETIDKLLIGKYSIVRFGDGEFNLCYDRTITFQKKDRNLRKRLRQIIQEGSGENCLVAIIEYRTNGLTPFEIRSWYENYNDIIKLLNKKGVYYNASITRQISLSHFPKIQGLWNNRFVIFIFGKGSRFDCKHEIFINIKGYSIVQGLPLNAWSEYEKLLEESCVEIPKHDNPLIIISLGPTATVLAYDLCQRGYQALDIGHITNMYDKLVYDKALPEELPFVH